MAHKHLEKTYKRPEAIEAFLSIAFALILVLLPFHAFFTSWAGNNLGHLDLFRVWKEIILLLTSPFVIYLAWKNEKIKSELKKSIVLKLFIVYVLLHLALGAWAFYSQHVNKSALIYALIINLRFIYFFLACYVVASYSDLLKRNIPKLILFPAIVVLLVGFIQEISFPHNLLGYFYGNTILAYQTIDGNSQLERVQSTMRGANPLGAYLILVLVISATFIKKYYLRWLALLGEGLILFYSYSRSAWIGSLIALWLLSWWLALKSHHKVWLLSSIVIIFLTFGGLFYLFKNSPEAQNTFLHTSSQTHSKISSNQARSTAIKNGFNNVVNQPTGYGPGTAGPASARNTPHPTRISENYYLQIGQEVGVIGLVIFLAITATIAKALWVRRENLLAIALLASLAGISFVNLLSHAWADDTLSLLWWGLAGICLASQAHSAKKLS